MTEAVQDEGYFWNRVTGLDTHHQTAVLALKHQATFPSFNVPERMLPPGLGSRKLELSPR